MIDIAMRRTTDGWGSGLTGVVISSSSLPATRTAVGSFSPLFLTSARAVVAAMLGAAMPGAMKQKRPDRADLVALVIVSLSVVVGFPLLTALALQHVTPARSIVFVGLLPLATTLFGVLRGAERPRLTFRVFSVVGSPLVAGFAVLHSGGASAAGHLLMVAIILLCGFEYAEGATLSRRLGGQVISWVLVRALPAIAPVALWTLPRSWSGVGLTAWAGLTYVPIFSMVVGFVFWYRGLALGETAGVGQLHCFSLFSGLYSPACWPNPYLSMVAVTALMVACVIGAKRFECRERAYTRLLLNQQFLERNRFDAVHRAF